MVIVQVMTNGVGAAKNLGGKRMKRGDFVEGGEMEEMEKLPLEQDQERQPHLCACNATYVSVSCCWSDDGYVWELPGLKIGEMKRGILFLSSKGDEHDPLDV
jgi:hypothetical protein